MAGFARREAQAGSVPVERESPVWPSLAGLAQHAVVARTRRATSPVRISGLEALESCNRLCTMGEIGVCIGPHQEESLILPPGLTQRSLLFQDRAEMQMRKRVPTMHAE